MFDFPFTAVAGQQTLKRALTLVAVDPAIGGVLISGPRGSAKSTLARGMADILPVGDAGKPPFITLPLGASEEMLVGTLDLQQALNERQVQFQAGLLAKAHQGVLYVDEVNLLPDNLVDLLLDVAASGENIVERDGISHRHAARFILLGTMNADEGELRPQLQDRFGLAVALDNQYTLPERIDIVRLREAFDASPATFVDACSAEQLALKHQIDQARRRLPEVQCDDSLRWQIAERCQQARVDGLRADIVWLKAARAHAALHERLAVNLSDLDAVESLVLQHRRQAEPTPPPPSSPPPFSRPPESRPDRSGEKNDDHRSNSSSGEWGQMAPQAQAMVATDLCLTGLSARESDQGKHLAVAPLAANADRQRNAGKYGQGRRKLTQPGQKVNWFATCLKNLNMLKHSGRESASRLQFHPRQGGQPVLHLVLLDTSASTLQSQAFGQAKTLILNLAERAYLSRQHLTLIGFGNDQVTTLLPQRRAPKSLLALLEQLPAAGGTPLRAMLASAEEFQKQQRRRYPEQQIYTYLLTDGRSRHSFEDIQLQGPIQVIDLEVATVKWGRARELARHLCARYLSLNHPIHSAR